VKAQFLPTSFVSARILSVDRHYDNILQAAPDHLNQKHSSSIEDYWEAVDGDEARKRAEPWWKEPTKGSLVRLYGGVARLGAEGTAPVLAQP
jgi:hypothetical protein